MANAPTDYVRRKALGRTVRLGDLYDARSDTFCGSMLKSAIPDNILNITRNPSVKFDYIKTDRQDEKLKKCDVEAELAVSVFCGLVSLSGHGRYFVDNTENSREVCVSLIYSVSTMTDRFLIPQVLPLISTESLNSHKQATHFVIEIDWGANAALTLKYSNDENYEKTKVQGYLEASLCKAKISVQGSGNADVVDSNSSLNLNYSINFYADISGIDDPLPTTVDEAINLIKKIPNLIKTENGGRGKALSFILVPISIIDCLSGIVTIDRLVTNLDNELLFSIGHIFSDIHEAKIKLNDIKQLFERNSFCIPDEKRKALTMEKAKTDRKESSMRQQIAETLKEVRSGRVEMFELEILYQSFKDEMILMRVDEFIERLRDVIERISFIADAKKENVVYIGNNSSFDEERRKILPQNEYYAMFYNSAQKDEKCSRTKELFYSLLREAKVPCFLADLNTRPDLATLEGVPNESIICHYRNGAYVDRDVYQTFLNERKHNVMKSICSMQYCKSKPNKRVTFQLICPGSIGGGKCDKIKRYWLCSKCKTPFEYGFDGMFYCDCGKEGCETFVYRCSDIKHGQDFVGFDSDILASNLKAIRLMPVINILVLGETGVGKSTWINAVTNYLTFSSLEEAADNDLRYLIPAKFTLVNQNNERKNIVIGSSDNECDEEGQACTKDAMSYQFQVDDKSIRIIDTPGINDPKGLERDKENIDNILKFISSLEEIHGICILLKPNISRLTPSFRYCIFEFLTHLHSSAVDNIIFCFTNSRSTLYKPGDTLIPLEVLVKDINKKRTGTQLEIILSNHTMYCLDNEAFRFLCALHSGFQYETDVINDFSSSWNISTKETRRMLKHIQDKRPHQTRATLSINEASRIILNLAKPITKISENIERNIRIATEQKDRISKLDAKNLKLKENLYIDYVQMKPVPIDYPKTVCQSGKCIEKRKIPGTKNETITIYKTVCHDHCYLRGVPAETIGAPQLEGCSAMLSNGSCKNCHCLWQMHLHITYDFAEELVKVLNEDAEDSINKNLSDREVQAAMISKLEFNIEQYKKEKEEILEVGSRFGSFLKHHSILPYNDAIEEHVRFQLEDAKQDAAVTKDYAKRNSLQALLNQYLEKKRCLDQWTSTNNTEVSLDEIPALRDRLMKLVHTGQCFKECFETAENVRTQFFSKYNNRVQTLAPLNSALDAQPLSLNQRIKNFFTSNRPSSSTFAISQSKHF